MKPFRLITILIALSFSRTLIANGAQESPRSPKREMKGMELYSWRDQTTQQWRFSLLSGTNRNKTADEIIEPKGEIKTVEELKTRLGTLAVGEYVSWVSRVDPKVLSLPPEDIVHQITAFCESKQIKVTIERK